MELDKVFVIGDKKYALDIKKIKEFCLASDKEKGGQIEVMEVQEPGDNGLLGIVSKTTHELKSTGNPQNDTISYDLVKLFIVTLLDSDLKWNYEGNLMMNEMTFAMRLSFNTLVEIGFLYEVK